MTAEKTQPIRHAIDVAKTEESSNPQLARHIAAQLPNLRRAIKLSPEQAETFVMAYIDNAPETIEALKAVLVEAQASDQARVFFTIAEDYFLRPESGQGNGGMLAMLDAAYLAYRLIEEVNDRFHMLCGAPISPTDLSISNIIVHALLGDKFANQLDMAVLYTIEALFDDECVIRTPECAAYLKRQKADNWVSLLERWPCLAGDHSMAFDMDEWLTV